MKGMFKKALAGVAAAALAVTGFAAATGSAMADPQEAMEPSITLTGDVAGRMFTAYPLGTYVSPQLDEDGACVDSFSLKQADGWLEPTVDGAASVAASESGVTIPDEYEGNVLAWIATLDTTDDGALLRGFANQLAGSVAKPDAADRQIAGDDDTSVVLNVGEDGWYLVTDTDSVTGEMSGTPILVGTKVSVEGSYLPLCSAGGSTGTASVKPSETAAPDKEVTDGSDDQTVTVGDEVTFEITNTIPNTTGYKTYAYVVTDHAGAGLQMPADDAYTVRVDRIVYQYFDPDTMVADEAPQYYYTVDSSTNEDGSTTTTITLNDVAGMDGLNVSVSYAATVVDDENIWNKASSDTSGWGTPVELNSYEFKFTKTDADDKTLSGAKFVVMKDGMYLKQVNGQDGSSASWTFVENLGDATEFEGVDGVFTFSGLEAGDYTVIETEVPEGYLETAKAEFTVTITADGTYKLNDDADNAHNLASYKKVDGKYGIYVMNVTSISQLPQTGAAGIALFVVLGLLIAGAGVTVWMKSRGVRNAING